MRQRLMKLVIIVAVFLFSAAGCDEGRYSIAIAGKGANLYLLDTKEGHLWLVAQGDATKGAFCYIGQPKGNQVRPFPLY